MGRIMAVTVACLLAASAAVPGQGQAQTIYRCTADGKVSYGEHPCPDGVARALPRTPAPGDAAAAAARMERDKARLAQLERARNAEALADGRAHARAAHAAAVQRRKCERLRLAATWARQDAARATQQAAGAARLKAQRQEQALAVECPA